MMVRGVRGAITVDANTATSILAATREVLQAVIEANQIEEEDVASILFTTTPDLTACFPAKAAREMGWRQVALMGFQEIEVPDGLKMCIRVLVHWNTTRSQQQIKHIFLGGASALRPDLFQQSTPAEE